MAREKQKIDKTIGITARKDYKRAQNLTNTGPSGNDDPRFKRVKKAEVDRTKHIYEKTLLGKADTKLSKVRQMAKDGFGKNRPKNLSVQIRKCNKHIKNLIMLKNFLRKV